MAIAAVPGAVPPPTPCAHSATWRIAEDPALSAEDNILARGMDQIVAFDSLTPPLRTLCPFLPWRNQPNEDVSLIPHMALATVAWAMFLLNDSAGDAVVEDWLLTPLSITRVMRRCVDQGLSMDAQEDAKVVAYLAQHVRLNYHADFELHMGDLGETEATGAAAHEKPAARLKYAAELTLLSMSTATRALYPMCTYEYVMGPRVLNMSAAPAEEGRHHPKSHYSRMWAKLTSVQATLHSSVQPVVADAGSTPEDVADAQLTAAGEFFVGSALAPSSHTPTPNWRVVRPSGRSAFRCAWTGSTGHSCTLTCDVLPSIRMPWVGQSCLLSSGHPRIRSRHTYAWSAFAWSSCLPQRASTSPQWSLLTPMSPPSPSL